MGSHGKSVSRLYTPGCGFAKTNMSAATDAQRHVRYAFSIALQRISKNEGISANMVSSIGAAGTRPGADLAGTVSDTVGDITSAFSPRQV
jgi:hypothetical protein